jgi:hypothetical protein
MANEIKIVENGEVVVFSSPKIETFRQSNALPHPFGVQAKTQGQSPVTLRVNFVDGNTCKFRGDLKTAYVSIMVVNLSELLKFYINQKKVLSAIIYDNRPEAFSKIILEWKENKIKDNLLPLYIHNYRLK